MQPQSRASILARDRIFDLAERFENHLQRLLRNANPGICHTELYAILASPGCYRDSALWSELHRVANQILEYDLKFSCIGVEHGQGLLHFPDKREPCLLL